MRSNLKGRYDFPTALDQRIEATQRGVEKQEATLASLTDNSHETTDARRRLVYLLTTLNDLLRMKIETR